MPTLCVEWQKRKALSYNTFFQFPMLRAGLSYGEVAERANTFGARLTSC